MKLKFRLTHLRFFDKSFAEKRIFQVVFGRLFLGAYWGHKFFLQINKIPHRLANQMSQFLVLTIFLTNCSNYLLSLLLRYYWNRCCLIGHNSIHKCKAGPCGCAFELVALASFFVLRLQTHFYGFQASVVLLVWFQLSENVLRIRIRPINQIESLLSLSVWWLKVLGIDNSLHIV